MKLQYSNVVMIRNSKMCVLRRLSVESPLVAGEVALQDYKIDFMASANK